MREIVTSLVRLRVPEAQILAANLKLYAGQAITPLLMAALQSQIDALRAAMKRRHQ
jgi:hypothetical protein